MSAWRDYQEATANVFRDLGFEADTDQTLQGVRTTHAVDVVARYKHVGLQLTWLIECKHWKHPVNKLHILALRTIVEDTGSDKGIVMAEKGFQSGAVEATVKSNVTTMSLDNLREAASEALLKRRLAYLPARTAAANARYWKIPKSIREDIGLRPDGPANGYSGATIVRTVSDLVYSAMAMQFPPRMTFITLSIRDLRQAVEVAEYLISDLESRLSKVEADRGVGHPGKPVGRGKDEDEDVDVSDAELMWQLSLLLETSPSEVARQLQGPDRPVD
ncbi:restriction endonuclease [Rathayibacter sp. AY1H3]|uniref:restriction endonuclease n=1 Tax=Rathayibacter sp. AY1H3 TaxID=2080567 RepID=UPI000CE86E84|nr:restriction endonuclease [Rathayibacter sp. AY1H3]PPH08673.1 restriction endonuclease [Rathayibacter sp. AY1H3]